MREEGDVVKVAVSVPVDADQHAAGRSLRLTIAVLCSISC
jgi:hypothetical protein